MNYTKLWGVGEALAPPNLGRNKNKVVLLKRPSHRPKFQKKRGFSQSSDNRADKIGGARIYDLSKEESKDRINSLLICAAMILNIILLSFFTKMVLVLPNKPKIVDSVIFTPGKSYIISYFIFKDFCPSL